MNHLQAIEMKSPMRYVLGELATADRDEFEDHLADCFHCMNEVWTATQFAANAREVFRLEKDRPAAASWRNWLVWRPFPAFAFSAALNVALAGFVGYGALRVYPSLRGQIAELNQPRIVDVVGVRDVVRGAADPQVVKTSGNAVVLSFDLPQRFPRYTYSIADTSGRVVLSGEAGETAASSLNLQIPVGRLSPGQYKVTADGIAESRSEELGSCLLQVGKR